MNKHILLASVVLSLSSFSALADKATVDALVAAKVPLTDAQKAELTAQGCTDAASCSALVESVAQLAASFQGNDAMVVAVISAFSKVHPEQASAALTRTIALAPSTAVALAALQLELTPAAAGNATQTAGLTAPANAFANNNTQFNSFGAGGGGGGAPAPISSSPSSPL